jgi:N-acetylglucosaminyl-diphospho-decaprenol L-rhamnosyltransferase
MAPGLSVIIVSWNAATRIRGCLESLLANPPERPFEIVVVDNASSDRSAEIARGCDGIELAALDTNRGFAGGCNEGCRRASYEYLLFLNSDIETYPGALERLCAFMDSHPEAAAASGRLVDPEGRPQIGFNVRAFPTFLSTSLEILMLDKIFPRNRVSRAQRMLDFSLDQTREVDQPAGACLLVRKDVFENVGRFDETFYPAWFEDVDLCLRIRRQGRRIYFVPETEFLHYGGASLETLDLGAFLSVWYRNLLRFYNKHHGHRTTLALKGLILVGMMLRLLASSFVTPGRGVSRSEARAAYWRVAKETL